MRKISFAIIFILLIFSANGHCLDILKTKTVFLEFYDNATSPTDIAFTDNKDFFVYEAMNGRIIEYKNFNKKNVLEFPTYKGGNCLVNIGREYYFCDSLSNRMLILDKSFKIKDEIKTDKFDPTDVVTYKNNLFIPDNDNHRLVIYNTKNRKIEKYLGKRGELLGEFSYPFSIAIDKDGFMFVSEVINTRVQLISPELKSIFAVGSWGVNAGQFYRPKGVAVIQNKYLVVSDGYIGVLQLFDIREGKFKGVLTDADGNIKRYSSPTRIRNYGNYLAIVDPYDRFVEIIDMGELK